MKITRPKALSQYNKTNASPQSNYTIMSSAYLYANVTNEQGKLKVKPVLSVLQKFKKKKMIKQIDHDNKMILKTPDEQVARQKSTSLS